MCILKIRDKLFLDQLYFGPRVWYDTNESRLKSCWNGRIRRFKNPLSKKRIEYVIKCAKELLPQLGKHEDEWLGLDQLYLIFYLF